jgi:ubiquinone biosynthesis protein
MVVVEGVARSLDPHMNIWQVARPVVENYIKESIGPKALLRDLTKTARVLARFGPRLPKLAEDALIRLNNPAPEPKPQRRLARLAWMALGGGLVGAVVWINSLM